MQTELAIFHTSFMLAQLTPVGIVSANAILSEVLASHIAGIVHKQRIRIVALLHAHCVTFAFTSFNRQEIHGSFARIALAI
ncbi:hypothetical protein FGO68_gene5033 [Halteria grandinella]|uniref:Uncharacterized protein n=1 Tax=Halteria grandinella TaxID=5974 RepID=A0A8J8P907_HALGN|nr:hypothetical protein FGO68_gene5033 [Halteria grandinella]